ncbi:ABC transporter substrate-binding protein [Ramlibacter sp.]|uniref:ABC transporter substrate-binding protein n=1 Tax=Ramlibacter sp. TaxID=1917967 RepID=UPI0026094B89|nr:ABC transporter substrate-binding protein [Ramlibacter sp.]MDB5956205.1 putative transporter protein periplasmic substrate-binding component precursor [Ramlibacter sp.]
MKLSSLCAAVAVLCAAGAVQAAEKVRFGLSWIAEAEHCGFFQAKATGLYDQAGLDVEIVNGGPDRNLPLQIGAGDLQLAMGSSFTTLHMLKSGVPAVTVAAFFQKDPQTLVAHPDQGIKSLADLKGKPIMVARFSQQEYWQFLKRKFGFSDEQLRPYTYSAAPFLVNPLAVQQGYITEDAMLLGKAMPKPPVSLLLADYGYSNYSDTVFGLKSWLDAKPQAVQAFVDATRAGWQQCITGDYTPAMKAILAMNPEHGEPLFHFKMKQIKERGLVDSGDARSRGIGTMTDARWKEFFEVMAGSGVFPADLDYRAAYTLKFVQPAARP